MKQRNHAFDLLCGLCILRMILLHTVSMCGFRREHWFVEIMYWTFFFMSFFFFKAGYFNKGIVLDYRSYLTDRARRLLVPYFVWGLIGSVIYFSFLYFVPALHPTLAKIRWSHVYTLSHFYGNPPCWFLFSFFCAYIVIGTVNKLHLNCIYNFIVPTFPFISYYLFTIKNPLWMSLNNVFMGLFFFQLGHWWRLLQDRLRKNDKEQSKGETLSGISPATVFLLVISCLLIAEFIYFNRHYHGEYDMSLNKWVHRPWAAAINATCALVGLSGLMLIVIKRRIPFVNYIGEHSMVFFVVHYPIIFIYRFSCIAFGHNIRHNWIDCVVLTALILIACRLLVPYIERVSWLSGRIKKKTPPISDGVNVVDCRQIP